jgi:cytochrome P450
MTTEAPQAIQQEEFLEFIARPDLRVDPFPFYARLQATEPARRLDVGLWLLSGHDYVAEVLRDHRFSSDERNSSMYTGSTGFEETPFGRVAQAMLLFRDDPDHKRLRDLVQKAFTRRVVEDLRSRIAGLVVELLTPIVERGSTDLMSEFAYPLPVIVICELLGVPVSDREHFHEWARDFATRFEVQPLRTPEMEERGDAATAKLTEYFDGLIEEKRKNPGDDLISSLATVEDSGDRLTHDETLATCLLILLAGHETTANLIGNGTLALLRNRDQWELLVREPGLVRSAVEEILRYDSPVQMIQRIALEDVTLYDATIPAGEMAALLLAAANRDPDHFPDPNRLDITRGDAPLVAFGGGIHFCLGAPLARLETQLALGALAKRAPGLQLAAEPKWRPMFVLRGLESLRLSV